MARWYRYNADLGCMYEIPEEEAIRRINKPHYIRHYDEYWGEFTDMWQNSRDLFRDIIFKSEG